MAVLRHMLLTVAILFLSTLKPSECQKRRTRANPAVANLLKNILSGSDGLLKLGAAVKGRNALAADEVLPSSVLPRSIIPKAVPNFATNGIAVSNYQQVLQPKLMEYPAQVGKTVVPIDVGKTVVQKVTPSVPVIENSCNPQLPARLVNPFLPAASPVSAIAPPTSSSLPPANINNPRSTFLRKIPIPPPSL